MTVDLNLKKISTNGTTQAGSLTGSSEIPKPNIDFNQSGTLQEQNITVSENSTTAKNAQNKRTVDELYNAVSPKLTQYGLALSKDEAISLLERIAGCPSKVLLNIENSEIQKILKCLEEAMKILTENKQPIDINQLGELANDYNIAIHTGWTIKEFQKKQDNTTKESLTDRLNRYYKDGRSLEDTIEGYFEVKIKEDLAKAKTPAEKDQVIKEQLRDFGRLLANSTDEEKELFVSVLKKMYADNRLVGLEALFQSLDSQISRIDLADNIKHKDLEELSLPDAFGDSVDSKQVEGMVHLTAQNQSKEGRKEFHKDVLKAREAFYIENKDIIKSIQQKELSKEALTPEEQEIKEKIDKFYKAVATGEYTGTITSNVLSENIVKEILKEIDLDTFNFSEKYDKNFYKEVQNEVSKYVSEHQESLVISQEEFNNLVAETVESSIVTSQQSNSETPVSQSEPTTPEVKKQKIQGSVGIEQKEKPSSAKDPHTLVSVLYESETHRGYHPVRQTSTPSAANIETAATKGGLKALKKFIDNCNINSDEVVKNILAMSHVLDDVRVWAFDRFSAWDNSSKAQYCENMKNNENKIIAMNLITSYSALAKVNCNNSAVQEAQEKRLEELQAKA